MNAISEASLQAILGDPSDPMLVGQALRTRVAVAAATRVMQAQREMGNEPVALLDPSRGTNFDRRV